MARTIAYSFEQDFSALAKDMERIAKTLENGLDFSRFVVAEQDAEINGITGCDDCVHLFYSLSTPNTTINSCNTV